VGLPFPCAHYREKGSLGAGGSSVLLFWGDLITSAPSDRFTVTLQKKKIHSASPSSKHTCDTVIRRLQLRLSATASSPTGYRHPTAANTPCPRSLASSIQATVAPKRNQTIRPTYRRTALRSNNHGRSIQEGVWLAVAVVLVSCCCCIKCGYNGVQSLFCGAKENIQSAFHF
jgi:hypothetical protein